MSKSKLTVRHHKAIEKLLECPSIEAAAKACKADRRTLYNYLANPEFKQALREAQEKALSAVIARLSGMGSDAVTTLTSEMKDAEAKSSDRSTAARITLDFLFRGHDIAVTQHQLETMAARLEQLEGNSATTDTEAD